MKLILLLSIISLHSCDIYDNDNPEYIKKYEFYPNSKIRITQEHEIENASIVSGDNIVFKYAFTSDDNPKIADDEFSDEIIFEIDPNLDNFVIDSESFSTSNSRYGRFCFCLVSGYLPITSGEIKGTKINEYEWQIDIDITIETQYKNITKNLSAIFQHHSFRHQI